MGIAYLCILIAAVLPYTFVAFVKFFTKGYDNSNPREFLNKIEGRAKRAHYAHLNAFEAFPAFAAAVILANLAGVSSQTINVLATLFVICRVFHGLFYILDKATYRSLAWFAGFFCVVILFILAIKNI